MSSIATLATASAPAPRVVSSPASIHVALLGCGNVGSAFAALAHGQSAHGVRITHALIRDCLRPRPTLSPDAERITNGAAIFDSRPDVVVELLGGIEPARSLVLEALVRGIPVVTANKSLLATHGAELREVAQRTFTPLLYEAAVIAGVPFLGTFGRRPYAADVTRLTGIANGTSNYILTRARDGRCGIDGPLAEAQRLGYAEPDPAKDVDGIDAAEKLVVLLQHFAGADVRAEALEVAGIRSINALDIDCAAELGGTIKPVISADWSKSLEAFAGPAFVPLRHVLASVDGAENGIVLGGTRGRLVFRGPGAGPEVTAATVMDDVLEATTCLVTPARPALRGVEPATPETGWFVILRGSRLPSGPDIADLLAAHGVYLHRTTEWRPERIGALTWPAARPVIERALSALTAAAGCDAKLMRALEA